MVFVSPKKVTGFLSRKKSGRFFFAHPVFMAAIPCTRGVCTRIVRNYPGTTPELPIALFCARVVYVCTRVCRICLWSFLFVRALFMFVTMYTRLLSPRGSSGVVPRSFPDSSRIVPGSFRGKVRASRHQMAAMSTAGATTVIARRNRYLQDSGRRCRCCCCCYCCCFCQQQQQQHKEGRGSYIFP